jgi:ABC-type nitrate/sulfonate/bicarbonate transport system substrate-binding protein
MKRIITLFYILTALFTLAAAGRPESGTALRPVTAVLDWSINTNHTGLYVALEEGYFIEEGLDVSIEFPPETGAASLVLSGRADFAVSYQEEVTYARAAGTPLKAVAAIIQHNTSGFASRREEGITRPRDFEGKTYGGWGSPVEEAMVRALVEGDGGDFSMVDVVPFGSMDFFAATASGIDFVWIFRGWDGIAAELKGIEITYIPLSTEPALDYYTPVLISREALIEEDPELVSSFLKAVSRGYEFAIRNPEAAADILLEAAPELDRKLVVESQRYLADEYRAGAPRWGEMKLEVWERYADWLDGNGLLEGKFSASEAFTNDFLPANPD